MTNPIEQTEHNKLCQILVDAGFTTGWALNDGKLIIWEHDQNPPAPLVKPTA